MTELVVKKGKKEKQSASCRWFVEVDPLGNQWVASELNRTEFVEPNVLRDSTGKEHNVYEAGTHKQAELIQKGAKTFGWTVTIWNQQGNSRIIKEWLFGKFGVKKKKSVAKRTI